MAQREERITWSRLVERRSGWFRLRRLARYLRLMSRLCRPGRDLAAIWRLRPGGGFRGPVVLHPRALGGAPVAVRAGTTDRRTFFTTFARRFHHPPEAAPARIAGVLDLGANVGYTAADLAARFPSASIVAVEMDAANFAQACRNTLAFRERVRCVRAAVWIDDAGVSYRRGALQDAFAVCVDDGACDGPVATAPSMTPGRLLDLLPSGRADFVKVDVEGAEAQLLRPGHAGWLARVESLTVELHPPAVPADVQRWLQDAGFTVRRSATHPRALAAWRPR